MTSTIGDRLPAQLECANLAKEWPQWKQQFSLFMRANGKMRESELEKVSMSLWCMGNRGTEIFNTLYPNDGDIENMFEQALAEDVDGEEDEIAAIGADAAAVAEVNERNAARAIQQLLDGLQP